MCLRASSSISRGTSAPPYIEITRRVLHALRMLSGAKMSANGTPDGLAVDTLDAGAALVLGFRRRCFACRYSTHTVPATTHRTRWSGHRREHSCARSLRPLLLPLPLPLPGLKL